MEILETDVIISFRFLSSGIIDAMQQKNKLLSHLPGAEF